MVFSDLLFLFLFLPLNLLLQRLMPNIRGKNIVMLLFSLFFYTWGEPVYVLLLIATTFVNWAAALVMEKRRTVGRSAKLPLVAACVVSLGTLSIFKYGMFFCRNLQALTGLEFTIPEIALPIGISFYTFQALSYTVDVYRGEVKAQRSFPTLLMYVSLFHQCIAGPIVRYSHVEQEILHRSTNTADIAAGVRRFSAGLAKKALLANPCGELADRILLAAATANDLSLAAENLAALSGLDSLALALGVLAWSLQIYLDFSAYSDMAIGMGLMVGFHYRENFDHPYISTSVSEFWRRWHISLGSFFRDYVYIPLGGNRCGSMRTTLNLLLTWLLTGLWHGASWNFVLWGLFFFVFLVIEKIGLLKILEKIPAFFSHIYLLIVVFFGWILFRFSDFRYIPVVIKGLFGLNRNAFIDFETRTLLIGNIIFIIVALFSVTPIVKRLSTACQNSEKGSFPSVLYKILSIILPLVILFLSTLALVGDSYNPFLYFQF